jgi:hypothetical protein
MTSEETIMFGQCKKEYQSIMTRIEAVIKDKWPETLQGDGGVWRWLDEHSPSARAKHKDLNQRLNEAWQNGMLAEVKKLSTQWGRHQLDIFKGYSAFLKQGADA